MLILPFIPFLGRSWAFFLCSLAIGDHCTVKPVKQGHPSTQPEVSLIQVSSFQGAICTEECNAVWNQIRCLYFTACPHFSRLLFTCLTVTRSKRASILPCLETLAYWSNKNKNKNKYIPPHWENSYSRLKRSAKASWCRFKPRTFRSRGRHSTTWATQTKLRLLCMYVPCLQVWRFACPDCCVHNVSVLLSNAILRVSSLPSLFPWNMQCSLSSALYCNTQYVIALPSFALFQTCNVRCCLVLLFRLSVYSLMQSSLYAIHHPPSHPPLFSQCAPTPAIETCSSRFFNLVYHFYLPF
jgi:hypothetical protein